MFKNKKSAESRARRAAAAAVPNFHEFQFFFCPKKAKRLEFILLLLQAKLSGTVRLYPPLRSLSQVVCEPQFLISMISRVLTCIKVSAQGGGDTAKYMGYGQTDAQQPPGTVSTVCAAATLKKASSPPSSHHTTTTYHHKPCPKGLGQGLTRQYPDRACKHLLPPASKCVTAFAAAAAAGCWSWVAATAQ